MNFIRSSAFLTYSTRFLSSTCIKRSQTQDMVAPRQVATELLKKRKEDKSRSKNTYLNKADIQVLGSSCQGLSPSILVNSEGNAYLFNCGEGTQRNCYANRVRLSNLEHLFVTRLQWPAVSGAYGLSLTLQDVGIPSFTVHSTEGISDFFKATEGFMSFTTGIECSTRDCIASEFDDSKFRVRSIPLDGRVSDSSDHEIESDMPNKRGKRTPTLVAFHCFLPDRPGQLNPQRCRELRVPIGPKLAILKSGRDVILDDGTVVKSVDVCGPPSVGPSFLVIDCPSKGDIDYLVQNLELQRIRNRRSHNDERQVDLVIHFSPLEVRTDSRYKQWIDGFPHECKHIMLVTTEFRRGNFIDSYRMQYLLQKIEPELFPSLYMPEKLSKLVANEIEEASRAAIVNEFPASDETELKIIYKGDLEEQSKIIEASAFDRFNLRPNKLYEFVEPKVSIDAVYRNARLEPDYDEVLARYHQVTQNLPAPLAHEPEVVFLGTGSALPSKLRNTSCILINLHVPKRATIILDCGEDSYGQIVRHYGPERAREVLENLKMIYVSHHHADHHIGLIEILRQRQQMGLKSVLQLLLPPGIDTHLNYYNDTFENLTSTYNITYTKDLRLRSVSSEATSNPFVRNLCNSLDGLLKGISVVNVEHCSNACAIVLDINVRRPGMESFRLAYSGDARPSNEFAKIGLGCDLLIHEATFDHTETMAAYEKKHSTTSEAIDLAKSMQAKFTILTHFSQKYPKIPYFNEKFDETIGFAFDNMAVRCPSQLPRLPLMKDIMSVVFAKSLNEIDARHNKVESKRRMYPQSIR